MKHILDKGQLLEKEPGVFVTEENERYAFIQGIEDWKREYPLLLRKEAYPSIYDFADAWVKQDEVALEEYRQKCLAVKDKYPKYQSVPYPNDDKPYKWDEDTLSWIEVEDLPQ